MCVYTLAKMGAYFKPESGLLTSSIFVNVSGGQQERALLTIFYK